MGVINEGDEVIVPANTYIATILAITDNRLKPIFVEPDIDSYNLDISLIERHISKKTKAIIVVHLYGQVCWSEDLENIARNNNIKIIEDNAQAIGAKWNNRRTGSLGDVSGFSFYPGKNLGALGDAGAIATNDYELSKVIRSLGNYGSTIKYINEYQGLNSRLDEIQSAFLDIKLKHIDSENKQRKYVAEKYINNISHPEIILPVNKTLIDEQLASSNFSAQTNLSHVWHLFVIRYHKRDLLQKYLNEKGIQTLIHYPIPPHKQVAYKKWNKLSFPVTEKIHREVLSLPISSVLSMDDIDEIIVRINRYK